MGARGSWLSATVNARSSMSLAAAWSSAVLVRPAGPEIAWQLHLEALGP